MQKKIDENALLDARLQRLVKMEEEYKAAMQEKQDLAEQIGEMSATLCDAVARHDAARAIARDLETKFENLEAKLDGALRLETQLREHIRELEQDVAQKQALANGCEKQSLLAEREKARLEILLEDERQEVAQMQERQQEMSRQHETMCARQQERLEKLQLQ
eukprot:jgi/Hompol1/4259/HPOL_007015-RA